MNEMNRGLGIAGWKYCQHPSAPFMDKEHYVRPQVV